MHEVITNWTGTPLEQERNDYQRERERERLEWGEAIAQHLVMIVLITDYHPPSHSIDSFR